MPARPASTIMLKVGITGGIGSGKTTVCRIFEVLGIPVFYADDVAKSLMDDDPDLKHQIAVLLGESVYASGRLDRAAVSKAVFNNPEKLATLNALVHPAAVRAANNWLAVQKTPYAIKETAIFYESGTHVGMDIMIGVFAPEEIRILRAMKRSKVTREEVLSRMARQMNDEEKMKRCDFVIVNDDRTALIPQVLELHQKLVNLSAS